MVMARNNGIKLCTSDYILFLDADDILRQDALVFFKKYINNGYKIIAGNRINKQGNIFFDTNSDIEFNQKEYLYMLYKNINLCWTSAVLLKKELLLNNNFNEKFSHGEDRDFFYRVLKGQKAIFTKNIVAEYVNDEDGLSNKTITPCQDLFYILIKDQSKNNPFNIPPPYPRLFFISTTLIESFLSKLSSISDVLSVDPLLTKINSRLILKLSFLMVLISSIICFRLLPSL